ncbi:hypothetical protein Tco_1427933 [Tanacetum coccineum]
MSYNNVADELSIEKMDNRFWKRELSLGSGPREQKTQSGARLYAKSSISLLLLKVKLLLKPPVPVPRASTYTNSFFTTTITTQCYDDKLIGKNGKPNPMKKLSKKDQLMLDEELAFKATKHKRKKTRLAEKKHNNKEAYIVSWEECQAMKTVIIKWLTNQAEEQENWIIERESKLFTTHRSKKESLCSNRAQETRNQPTTKLQRKTMFLLILKKHGWIQARIIEEQNSR